MCAQQLVSDIDSIDIDAKGLQAIWDEISKDNKFNELLGEAIGETLVEGDGAFKITIDTDFTPYLIIEYYSGEKVDYNFKRGRLQEILFYTSYAVGNKEYSLEEIFRRGYIRYKLYNQEGKEVPISTVEETSTLQDTTYTGDFVMGIPLKFFKYHKFSNRGKSVFDSKTDAFDSLDETLSQWIDAIRDGRVKQYIAEAQREKEKATFYTRGKIVDSLT